MVSLEMGNRVAIGTVPVTVLTGFLGAGKTTLLNRILKGDHGLRVAVLVNDFGSINIDADLIVGVENGGAVISLANGCVCCNIRDDLLAAVTQVIECPQRPEYVVLEASGVADPSGIAVTFLEARLRDCIRLDSVMCVVDASQILAVPDLMELKLRQIAFSDLLILNKTDLVSCDEISRIKAWLDEHFHCYRLVEAMHGQVPLEILLSAGRFDPVQLDQEPSLPDSCNDLRCNHDDHAHVFSTWSYQTDQPLSLDALSEAARKLPANIYRCKGVIHSADEPKRRAVLQVVGKRVDITLENEWGKRTPRTQIVAIGVHATIDGDQLRAQFEHCLAELVHERPDCAVCRRRCR